MIYHNFWQFQSTGGFFLKMLKFAKNARISPLPINLQNYKNIPNANKILINVSCVLMLLKMFYTFCIIPIKNVVFIHEYVE